MKTLIAKLGQDLNSQDISNPTAALNVIEVEPDENKKILAFEFDMFVAKKGKNFHVASILLSELNDIMLDFEKEFGRSAIVDYNFNNKGATFRFYDQSNIEMDFLALRQIETWIRPNQTIPKLFRGYVGTFQYFDKGTKKFR